MKFCNSQYSGRFFPADHFQSSPSTRRRSSARLAWVLLRASVGVENPSWASRNRHFRSSRLELFLMLSWRRPRVTIKRYLSYDDEWCQSRRHPCRPMALSPNYWNDKENSVNLRFTWLGHWQRQSRMNVLTWSCWSSEFEWDLNELQRLFYVHGWCV